VGSRNITPGTDVGLKSFLRFLARDVFAGTNCHAIAMMLVRPSIWDGRAF